jgi:hypothetical protein
MIVKMAFLCAFFAVFCALFFEDAFEKSRLSPATYVFYEARKSHDLGPPRGLNRLE